KVPSDVWRAVRGAFPTGNDDLDREITRILAAVEDDDPELLRRVAERVSVEDDPVACVHYLIVLARLKAPRAKAVTAQAADALLRLDARITAGKLNRDRNWPLRLG